MLQQLYNLVDTWVVGHDISEYCTGSRRFVFYVNDLLDIDRHRALFLEAVHFIDGLWQKDQDLIETAFYFCGYDRLTGGDPDRDHLYLDESDDPSASGAAGKRQRRYGNIFLCLYRIFAIFISIMLQMYCVESGKFRPHRFFPWNFRDLKIFLDLYFVLCSAHGDQRCGRCDRDRTVCFRSVFPCCIFWCVIRNTISAEKMKWNRENLKQIMSLSGFTCLRSSP